MVEYATLEESKDYLEIPEQMNKYDSKISIILSAINQEISEITKDNPVDSRLKLATLKALEYNTIKKTGSEKEKDGEVTIEFKSDVFIPASVMSIISKYAPKEDEKLNNTARFY